MEQENQTANNQQRIWLIVGGVVVVILIIVGILLFINMFSGNNEEGSAQAKPDIAINQPAQGFRNGMFSGSEIDLPQIRVVVNQIGSHRVLMTIGFLFCQ